jgi:rhodanese-related sulfurtransferase
MKKITNILFYIVISLMIGYILYQKGYIFKNYEDITPQDAYNAIISDANITIVDVRTKEEVQKDGKLENSILIPVQVLDKNLDKLIPYKSRKIFVYCRSGNRSITASRILSNAGFKVYNIKGGIKLWKKSKLPFQ